MKESARINSFTCDPFQMIRQVVPLELIACSAPLVLLSYSQNHTRIISKIQEEYNEKL